MYLFPVINSIVKHVYDVYIHVHVHEPFTSLFTRNLQFLLSCTGETLKDYLRNELIDWLRTRINDTKKLIQHYHHNFSPTVYDDK